MHIKRRTLNTKQGSRSIIRIQILCIICDFERCHSDGMQREDENIVKSLFIGMLFDNFEHNDEKTESKLLQIILVNDQTSQGMT